MAHTSVTDPLNRAIRFTDANWHSHVAKHHPEVAAHRRLAELAVKDPFEIRISASDADVRLYYGRGPRPGVMMVVVANVMRGYVKTAHLVKAAKGVLEWSRPNP